MKTKLAKMPINPLIKFEYVVKNVTPNVTIDVTLSVDIPSYVSQASQSKITVTARMQPVNTSQLTVG